MRTLWALAVLAAAAESLSIQDAAITSGNGEDEDNPADEGKQQRKSNGVEWSSRMICLSRFVHHVEVRPL